MKRGGFKKPTYEEAIAKQQERQAKRAGKGVSASARASQSRAKRKGAEHQKSETDWKKRVRLRDNYHCQYPGCRVVDKSIHCHHVAPRSQRKDLIYVVSNGKCLCFEHHDWVHAHPHEAVKLGLLSKETREKADKEDEVLPYPGED